MTRPRQSGLFRALLPVALLLSALHPAPAEAGEPKRVLVIHSFGRDFAPYSVVGTTLRTELTQLLRNGVAFQDISLDGERGVQPEDERLLVDHLLRRNRESRPDLVVTNAAPALGFYLRHRAELFPQVPLLVTAIDNRRVAGAQLAATDRVVSVNLDFRAMARDALALRPDIRTVALVLGSSPLEKFWTPEIERELAALNLGVHVLPPDGLTLDQMRARVASLPPHSAVFYYMFASGSDGALYENERALAAIHESSNAPVFGMFSTQLGNGIIGGSLLDARKVGGETARLAVAMLDGRDAGGNLEVPAQAPVYDARELLRWQIPESRLPAGAEVRFRTPSLWEQHRVMILAATAILGLQTALIAALLFQRTRRRRAEAEAAGLGGRLLTAHEDERRRIARELHDDLTQRLARLAIDAARLERSEDVAPAATAMRKDLVQLSEDVHAMSYRLHPSVLDDLGLAEALRVECDRVARHGALRVEVDARELPLELHADTSLCLFRVAQEALNNAIRHAQAGAVTVLLAPSSRGLQLSVSDNGKGFDATRSRKNASLGLASMRERVRLLQGTLDIESTPGRGTTVVAWVPV